MKITDAQYQVLKSLYETCFDQEGCVKACGRFNCTCLIQFLDDLTGTTGNYGNVHTGFLNSGAIHSFVKSIEVDA